MAVFAVYIEKEAAYQGAVRPFGNTYHYQTAPGQDFTDEATAELVAAEERKVTLSDVEFKSWVTWGPTDGPPLGNVIRQRGTFAFAGDGTGSFGMYRENCALVVWEIARSATLNRRRWLRKFLRNPGAAGVGMNDATLSGESPMPQTILDPLIAYGNAVKAITPGSAQMDPYTLCTEDGDAVPLATATEVRPFLITRQIGE
jgi:hypothetical protein